MKLLVVYNPHAGHDRAGKLLPEVKKRFDEKNISAEWLVTERPGHAVELVRGADFSKYEGLVVAGGDGTLFETVNGFFQNISQRRIPLGVLPVGTGNAFARDLYLNGPSWIEAVDVIALNKTKKVDVGRFQTEGKDYYYLNILGLGFVADVVDVAHRLKWMGNFSYTAGVLYKTVFLKSHHLKIEADGKTMERENVFVEISNTRYTSNFLMAPGAKIDDGFLDVTLLSKLTRRRLLACFPKIFTGEHIHMPEVEQFQAKNLRIETDTPKVLTPDGELLGSTPVHVECLKQAVDVYCK
jgi:YegS/Rv2252/BmrU family lipid kinase